MSCLRQKAGIKGWRCGLISVCAQNWLHLVCSIKIRDIRSTNFFYLLKLIWKCSSQQCAPSWLVVSQAWPTVFDKIGCKNLGEVKWPVCKDESDWSILNWLNTVMCLRGSLARALECHEFINHTWNKWQCCFRLMNRSHLTNQWSKLLASSTLINDIPFSSWLPLIQLDSFDWQAVLVACPPIAWAFTPLPLHNDWGYVFPSC